MSHHLVYQVGSGQQRIRGEFTDNLITQNEARELLNYEGTKTGDVYFYQLTSSDVLPTDDTYDEGTI